MENISTYCYNIYVRSIGEYHLRDNVNALMNNPYAADSLDGLFYEKSWIDTVQWHLEDIIRDPDIEGGYGLSIKRRIDNLNQKRTEIVEFIDDYFQDMFKDIVPKRNARHNTESLGWAFDRLSILSLKEFHLNGELNRNDASVSHREKCLFRKKTLVAQMDDLLRSINWLVEDIRSGKKINKVYKQLKMYNDSSLNPVLYRKQGMILP